MSEFAFPFPQIGERGISKRELFAAMALSGMLGDPERNGTPEAFANSAVANADALIAELAKPTAALVPAEPYCKERR